MPEGMRPVTGEAVLGLVRTTRARAVLVNAWASWCVPCRKELPMLVQMQAAYPSVQLMLVSVDAPDEWEKARDILREVGAPLPGYVVTERLGAFKPALNPRWKGMIPASFLFDPSAKLRYFWGGPVYDDELLPLLDRFLAGEQIDGEAVLGLAPGLREP